MVGGSGSELAVGLGPLVLLPPQVARPEINPIPTAGDDCTIGGVQRTAHADGVQLKGAWSIR